MTMKEIIGSIDMLRRSVWFSGGSRGCGNFSRARVAMKIAPTPTECRESIRKRRSRRENVPTRPKMTTENRLSEGSDIRYPFIENKNDRQTAKQYHQDGQSYQPPNTDSRVLIVER